MKNKLEIIIPTFNRQKNLKESLEQFLAENSPVKECKITILDNCSTDDTQAYCQNIQTIYPNINYIRHNKNIGMGANITRAMEIATMPYYWLVGDDDNYDFSNWKDVENAMNDNADCIVVADFTIVDNSIPSIVNQLGLLSAGIYKTENITSDVLQNANANIINMFPHMALICDLVNKNKKFTVTNKPIALWGISNPDPEGKAYIRGARKESDICPRLKYMYLTPAWFNCLDMLNDKKLKNSLINEAPKYSKLSKNMTTCKFIEEQVKINKKLFNNYLYNTIDIFTHLSTFNKIIFILYLIKTNLLTTYKDNEYKYFIIFGIKIKLKRKGKLFKNDNN